MCSPVIGVVHLEAIVEGDLDLAAEEALVMRHVQRLLGVLGLLEADDGVALGALADDLHRGHLAVLLVLVEQAVLQGRVCGETGDGRTSGQAHIRLRGTRERLAFACIVLLAYM